MKPEITFEDFKRYYPYAPTALAIKECVRLNSMRDLDCAQSFSGVVDAAQCAEVIGVEALDADRQPVDTQLAEGRELLRFERARIRLERDLRFRRQRQSRTHCRENGVQSR